MPTARPLSPSAALTALVTAAALFLVALSQGSYDVVDRQGAAVVLWWAVGLGALVAAPPRRPSMPGVVATAFAAGIAAWIALDLSHSISAERSVVELGRAVTHLGPLVLIGWVLPKRLWRAVLVGLLIGAVLICVAALGQRLSPGFLGQSSSIIFSNTTRRLGSPLGYWNAVGSWSVITTLLLLAVSAHAPRPALRAAAIAFVPLATTVGYLTYSRSSIGALALGLVVLIGLSAHRWTTALHAAAGLAATGVCILAVRGAPEIAEATGSDGAGGVLAIVVIAGIVLGGLAVATGRFGVDGVRMAPRLARASVVAGVLASLVAGGLAVDRYGQKAWDQFNTPGEVASANPTARLTSLNGTRLRQWRAALDSWKDDRVHGSGAGTFELTWNARATDSEFVRDAHNAFLETLSEQGTPGFALLLGLVLSMVAVVAVAARRARTVLERGLIAGAGAALAAFVLGTAVDWFWEVTALALLALGLLGALMAAGAEEEPAEPVARARGRGAVSRAAVVLLALLAVLIELPGLVGTSEVRRSEREVARGDLTAARTHADQAIDIMYWASSPYLQRALVDERAGQWRASRQSLRLAIRRDPQDWRLPLVLARVEAKAGRPRAALRAYRQAKALRPNGQFFR